MLNIRKLSAKNENFTVELDALLAWETVSNESVNQVVKDVLKDVRTNGDAALLEYTERFDRMKLDSADQLEIPKSELLAALERISPE